jgi:hypothetical protein
MSDRRHLHVDPRLDRYFPPCGPCAFCGHIDKRHRLWDVLIDSTESTAFLARDYDLPVAAVRLVRRIRPYRRAPHV